MGGITYLDSIMLDYPGPDAESIKGQWEALEDMQATQHNLTNRTRTEASRYRNPDPDASPNPSPNPTSQA